MKMLIANLPGIKKEDGKISHLVKAGSRWPMTIGHSKSVDYYPFPFWLAYTSSLLKRDTEAQVKAIDGVARDMDTEQFTAHVQEESPDILLVELATIAIKDDLGLLKSIKELTNAKIIVSGQFATAYPKELLAENPHVDYLLIGEYELTAKELITSLIGKRNVSKIKGLAYRSGKKIIINERRPLIKNLNMLPYPDRDDFPGDMYPDFSFYSPCIQILSSRGCPCSCIFCIERHVMYNSPVHRMRDPKDVVDEMEFCIKKFNAKQFYFDDQSFVINKKYVMAICDEIIKRGIKVPWTCMGDAMFVDFEVLKKMSDANCIGMKFGVDSTDTEILKRIGKPLKLEMVEKVVKWCREVGIRSHATYCIGLPGDTEQTIRKSMEFAKKLNADSSQVSIAIPYPGTPFFKWAKENNYLITYDWSDYDGAKNAVISYPNLSNERLDELYREFSRAVNRRKLFSYLLSPRETLSLVNGVYQRKGFFALFGTLKTFLKRSI